MVNIVHIKEPKLTPSQIKRIRLRKKKLATLNKRIHRHWIDNKLPIDHVHYD